MTVTIAKRVRRGGLAPSDRRVSLAARSQDSSATASRPAVHQPLAQAGLALQAEQRSASASALRDGTRIAPSPSVSAKTGRSATTTGVPRVSASTGVKPKPSSRETHARTSAPS